MKKGKIVKQQFVHKKNCSLELDSADEHFIQTAGVRTFASGAIWDSYDVQDISDLTSLWLHFDLDGFDGLLANRAYKEQKSGVIILETTLWDYENECVDYNQSVFQPYSAEMNVDETISTEEEYYFVAKTSFYIRGLDDMGNIAHNLIYIPAKTPFSWVKEGISMPRYCANSRVSPSWHMTSLRNKKIGIEINLPTKYIDTILKTIDEKMPMPVDNTEYPYTASCHYCKKSLPIPYRRKKTNVLSVYGHSEEGKELISGKDFICDDCYKNAIGMYQSAWSFQTAKRRFLWPEIWF